MNLDIPKRNRWVARSPAGPLGSGLRPPNETRSCGLDSLDCRGGVPGAEYPPSRVVRVWRRVLGQGR